MPKMPIGNSSTERLFSDWMALVFSTMSPSDLGPQSKGLCEHAPWIDDVVDFEKLKKFEGEFYMNAYNITDHKMEIFDIEQITPDHFRAALAFPFIYPPFKLNGKTYIEGSAIDTLCFRGLFDYRQERVDRAKAKNTGEKPLERLRHIVVFDTLSSEKIIREPRNLYDAWIQSIMVPLVEIAQDDLKLFEHKYQYKWDEPRPILKPIKFDIPEDHWPHVLDWSYSNLSLLYDVGYKAGLKFFDDNEDIWPRI